MSAQRPPGWYPDASVPGFERWWDGGTWSPVTRPSPTAAPPSSGNVPAYGVAPGAGPWSVPSRDYQGAPGYTSGYAPGGSPNRAATVDGRPLAPQGLRLVARVLDWIVVSAVALIVGWNQMRAAMDALQVYVDSLPQNTALPSDFLSTILANQAIMGPAARYSLISTALTAVYFVVLTALRGATLGKMAVGIKVTPADRDALPSWGQALLRWAMTTLPSVLVAWIVPLPIYSALDSLWCLWDAKRQCLHDKLPRTVVVRSR